MPEATIQPQYTTEWSKPTDFTGGFTQYRIELSKTDHGWYQRHIWRHKDGRTETDDWIASLDFSRPGALDHYTKIETAA